MKKRKINIGLLIIIFFIIIFTITNYREGRSYDFPRLYITAEILPDGSMLVVEERTADFRGTFEGLTQWINKRSGAEIVDVVVKERGVPYEYNPGSSPGPPGTYYTIDEYNRLLVDWSFAATDVQRTFTLSYQVKNAVAIHEDTAELYYQFVGRETSVSTEYIIVKLTLPAGAGIEDIKAFGHGPLSGEVYINSGEEVLWDVRHLPPNTFLEARLLFPKELVPEGTRETGRVALPHILAEEERWAAEANQRRLINQGVWGFTAIIIIFSFFGIIFIWLRYGKEHKTNFLGDYYRELPGNRSPAELGVLWNYGKVNTTDFTATIMDLARRGYLRIDEYVSQSKGMFSREKTGYAIVNLGKQEPVAPHEHELLTFLFVDVAYKKPYVTFKEIEEYAKLNGEGFYIFWEKWQKGLKKRGEESGIFDEETKKGKNIASWIGNLLLVGALGVFLIIRFFQPNIYLTSIFAAFLLTGVIFKIFTNLLKRRSRQGAEEFVRWQAFRRFLLHFSEMQRHEIPSLIIWEHYLVYAVTLGVAKSVIKQLQLVYPDLQDGSHRFCYGWCTYGYSGGFANQSLSGSFNNMVTSMENSFNQSFSTATSSSSSFSGGGGGFSGGGGGGGGGGGISAR